MPYAPLRRTEPLAPILRLAMIALLQREEITVRNPDAETCGIVSHPARPLTPVNEVNKPVLVVPYLSRLAATRVDLELVAWAGHCPS